MSTTDEVGRLAEVAQSELPKKAQFFTSWDDAMPDRTQHAAKLTGPLADNAGLEQDVRSVWYDFGTVENPGRVFIVKYGPGYVGRPHSHDTDYCSLVVEGSIEVTRRTFGRGSIRFVKAGTTYGPIVAGPDGATVIEFFPGPTHGRLGNAAGAPGDSPRHEPYDFFTAAARQVFVKPWVN
jgi:hypothetical protein